MVVAKHWSVPLWVKGGDKTGGKGLGQGNRELMRNEEVGGLGVGVAG